MKAGTERKSDISNGFMKIIYDKYTGFNIFKKWISDRRFKKACKKIFDTSPSFGQLWNFADFIKQAEEVFFYNNKRDSILYSSTSYKAGESGFVIISPIDNVNVLVKLYAFDSSVVLDIKHLNGTNMTKTFRFKENDWDIEHKDTDEIILDNIIGIINRHIVMLLKFCYNRRGSYDYEKLIPEEYKHF